MSDIFHEGIPSEFIGSIFETMNRCPQHTFIVLTKRADRMLELAPTIHWSDNIWVGVTVEEARYTGRIKKLKQTAAVNKFICAEPLLSDLGEMDLTGINWVVVGGESGKDSRPCNEEWLIDLRDQCEALQAVLQCPAADFRFQTSNVGLHGAYLCAVLSSVLP